jgi:class 3 adenylate cyclase
MYFFLTIASHLAAIPMISYYGLRVCPTLHHLGFFAGCSYVGSFVVAALFFNFIFLGRHFFHLEKNASLAILRLPLYSLLIYGLATVIALLVLAGLFHMQHLSPLSRAPEILAFLSLLLGVMQYYLVCWLIQPVLRQVRSEWETPIQNFRRNWWKNLVSGFFPILLSSLFLLHFLLRQSTSFNEGAVSAPLSLDAFIEEATLVILTMLAWLFVVYCLYFATESDQADRVRIHLDRISAFDPKFRSSTLANGVWRNILHSLNRSSQLLLEKSRLLEGFSKFVSESVAERALQGSVEVGGVRKELTVFMSDLRGFTKISQELHPEKVVKLLNIYFSGMLEELSKHGVIVDKFIGDGILGYVLPDEKNVDDNEVAVRASLGMMIRLLEVNKKLLAENLPELSLGIGIVRGPVILGNIGSQTRMQYTVVGDTVNRAARIESLCKQLQCKLLLDKFVYLSLPKELQRLFQSKGTQVLKGIQEPVEIFGLV